MGKRGQTAGRSQKLTGPGLVDLANHGGKTKLLIIGHSFEHSPKLRLQRQGRGVAGQIDRAFAQGTQGEPLDKNDDRVKFRVSFEVLS